MIGHRNRDLVQFLFTDTVLKEKLPEKREFGLRRPQSVIGAVAVMFPGHVMDIGGCQGWEEESGPVEGPDQSLRVVHHAVGMADSMKLAGMVEMAIPEGKPVIKNPVVHKTKVVNLWISPGIL